MSIQQASPADLAGIGIAFAAAGAYFILTGVNVLPSPGELGTASGIIVLAGAAFLLIGVIAMVRAIAGHGGQSAALWRDPDALRRATAIGGAGTLASIGGWIAIGSGPQLFDLAAPAEIRTFGETVGRAVFVLAVMIVWIYAIALSVAVVRKVFNARAANTEAAPPDR